MSWGPEHCWHRTGATHNAGSGLPRSLQRFAVQLVSIAPILYGPILPQIAISVVCWNREGPRSRLSESQFCCKILWSNQGEFTEIEQAYVRRS